MALPTLLDHEMVAGDDSLVPFQVVDDAGVPRDITGWDLTCRVVHSEAQDAVVVFTKTLAAGQIVVTSATTGSGHVVLDAADTVDYFHRELPLMIETVDLAGDRQVTAQGALSLNSRL